MKTIQIPKGKKIYFTSDHHFGAPSKKASKAREKKFVAWLDNIKKDAEVLFILGDLFDFWFEYKHVIPKGFTRVLGKLAELSDHGIEIHFFSGNHDMWMRNYFEEEFSIEVYNKPQEFELNGKIFLIGHGDGLGDGDYGYKILKKIFINKVCQALYRLIHPDIGLKLGRWFSGSHKEVKKNFNAKRNNERLINYCKEFDKKISNDTYIFGHSHYISEEKINNNAFYYNAGDWITNSSYLVLSNNKFKINKY